MAGEFIIDDIDVFMNADEFAVSATCGAHTFNVIFDAAYASSLGGLVESTGPQCVVKASDVAAASIAQGSVIAIGGVNYTVTGVQPDGTGVDTLQLRG